MTPSKYKSIGAFELLADLDDQQYEELVKKMFPDKQNTIADVDVIGLKDKSGNMREYIAIDKVRSVVDDTFVEYLHDIMEIHDDHDAMVVAASIMTIRIREAIEEFEVAGE